jgi:hypothetical protein
VQVGSGICRAGGARLSSRSEVLVVTGRDNSLLEVFVGKAPSLLGRISQGTVSVGGNRLVVALLVPSQDMVAEVGRHKDAAVAVAAHMLSM